MARFSAILVVPLLPPATTALDVATFVIAVFAALVSLALAVLRFWEQFGQRGKLGVAVDWIVNAGAPVLRLVIFNEGRKKECIREVRFGTADTPAGEGWFPWNAVGQHLPLVLDADEASRSFLLQSSVQGTDPFDVALYDGTLKWLEVETIKKKVDTFVIPRRGT